MRRSLRVGVYVQRAMTLCTTGKKTKRSVTRFDEVAAKLCLGRTEREFRSVSP